MHFFMNFDFLTSDNVLYTVNLCSVLQLRFLIAVHVGTLILQPKLINHDCYKFMTFESTLDYAVS